MALTPQQLQRRASLAADTQWSREVDRTARTAKARQTFLDRFQRAIDAQYPDVDPKTRAKMANNAMRAHMKRMAWNREKARRARKAGGGDAT